MRFARLAATILGAVVIVSSGIGASEPLGSSSMDEFTWKNRLLLLFAPSADEPILSAQRGQFADHRQGLIERDVIVIEIAADQVTVVGQDALDLEAIELRERYGVSVDEPAVLLIGKDGGVKIRQSQALSAESLFATIDAMPMRQREMRVRQ